MNHVYSTVVVHVKLLSMHGLSEQRKRSSWSKVDERLPAEDLEKGSCGVEFLKQRESVNFPQGVVVNDCSLATINLLLLMLFNIIEKSHKVITNNECNCSTTNLWVKEKSNGINVAMEKKTICSTSWHYLKKTFIPFLHKTISGPFYLKISLHNWLLIN